MRRRKCDECGKPLGGTLGTCYKCGGEKPSPSRTERLASAKEWKLILGVKPSKIKSAHNNDSN